MAQRVRANAKERAAGGGNYFSLARQDVEFIPTGSKLLDLALGGGWAERRIANIIGDKSSGKTLLCIEAAANFARKYAKGEIRYRETEAAFLPEYAGALGMPLSRVDFGDPQKPLETVEDLFEDLTAIVKVAKRPTLYILDSLDALSDRAEMERDFDEGSYGTQKAKYMSKMFRMLIRQLAVKNVTILVVSQIRSKIGVTYGEQTTRTGGRALDFYCSQVLSLAQTGKDVRTVGGIKRVVGVDVLGRVKKNKIGLSFREAEFNISFGYGIEDVASCVAWLKQAKALNRIGVDGRKDADKEYLHALQKKPDKEFWAEVANLHKAVDARWREIDASFLPTRRKYGQEQA